MDGYDLIRRVERATQSEALTLPTAGRLAWSDVARYRKIDPGNARLRWLESETVGAGAARFLWMPPALPYHSLAGPFENGATDGLTKRLVFSSWAVVPRAVAALLSYSAGERCCVRWAATEATNARPATRGSSNSLCASSDRPACR